MRARGGALVERLDEILTGHPGDVVLMVLVAELFFSLEQMLSADHYELVVDQPLSELAGAIFKLTGTTDLGLIS